MNKQRGQSPNVSRRGEKIVACMSARHLVHYANILYLVILMLLNAGAQSQVASVQHMASDGNGNTRRSILANKATRPVALTE